MKVHGPKKTGQRQTQGNINYIHSHGYTFLYTCNVDSGKKQYHFLLRLKTKLPLHWSLVPGAKKDSLGSLNQTKDNDTNWLLTTRYSTLPRHRGGSLRSRHYLRPETSLPIDEPNGNQSKPEWISEIHRSFQKLPDDAFEKPNKVLRRLNYRKQTALIATNDGLQKISNNIKR